MTTKSEPPKAKLTLAESGFLSTHSTLRES